MEPTNKPSVSSDAKAKDATVVEFLPDADEIERRPLPRLARMTLWVLMAALISFLIFASFAKVDRVVIARGRLITPLPNIVVQPLETSIIQNINVKVGQVVKKGEALATLDPTFTDADQAELRLRLNSLDTQSKNLEAELSGNKSTDKREGSDAELQASISVERLANYQAQLRKLEENLGKLKSELDTNQKDQTILESRVKYLREMETMQENLVAQQYGARVNYLAAQDRRLEVEREMLATKNREQELKRDLAASLSEKAAFEKGWRQKTMEDLLATSRDRDAVNEQLQKADKRHKLVNLVSPSDAVVLEIAKLSRGSVIKEAETLFTLVPLGSKLEAEVQIDSLDVGYIKANAKAFIKLDAFPFQRHGTLPAQVRTISEDAFRRDAANLGQGLDAYYLSRMSLDNLNLKNMSDRTRVLPGMTLTAEIVVGQRSVMSYLMWPLTKALDEALKEP